MQEPLVPADADVRGFKDMPVEVSRLLSSETWIMCTPEERSAAINLWFHSWMQVPAGSLPDNDRVLAHLSMASEKWPEVKDMALRGWVKADDGRLYHPVVCEKVGAMLAVRARKVDAGRKGGSISKSAKTKKKPDPEATAKHQLNGSKATAKLQPSYSQAPFPSLPCNSVTNVTDGKPSPRDELFALVAPTAKQFGMGDKQTRSLFGQAVKMAGGDHAAVVSVVKNALRAPPLEFAAWLIAACKPKSQTLYGMDLTDDDLNP